MRRLSERLINHVRVTAIIKKSEKLFNKSCHVQRMYLSKNIYMVVFVHML
jgi:hypothetical protein